MGFFERLGLDSAAASIDWELTPADTFGMFESWGGKERVRNKNERFYYFYIDGWEKPARLRFMERGIKYARVLADIEAPAELIEQCIAEQGRSSSLDSSYAIDQQLKQWLRENVIDSAGNPGLIPQAEEKNEFPGSTGLPLAGEPPPDLARLELRSEPCSLAAEQLAALIRDKNVYDAKANPGGDLDKYLVDNGDNLTVTDMVTGLMWQRSGSELNSIRSITAWMGDVNEAGFAGHNDWRLPTTLESLTLLEKTRNSFGLFIHPCFNPVQAFIFTADQRQPGGRWFVDYNNGASFWASAFNPGGYGRLVRNVD